MDKLLSLLKNFDSGNFMPEMDRFVSQLAGWLRLILLAAPLVLLVLGFCYYYAPPDEANYSAGYRTKASMRSVASWQFAQRYAGKTYAKVGAVLGGVMLVLSLFFGLMGPLAMAVVTLLCILVEAVLILLVYRHIDRKIQSKFDKNGEPRR